VTKGLFDHHAGRQTGTDQSRLGELLDHGGKVVRSRGEIEDVLGEPTGFGEVIEDLF